MDRHILVTNDDGIESPGLWRLAEVLVEFGKVLLVAPASDVSGSGTMVSYRRDLQVQPVPERLPGVRAYMVDGTPADCVLIGLRRLKEGRISVIAAGINPGANLGADLFLSGTCGAALIGAFRRVTSLAIALDIAPEWRTVEDAQRHPEALHWETAEAVARMLARGIEEGTVPEGAFLNVNVPTRPLSELTGVAITRPAPGGYMHLKESGDGVTARLQREIVPDLRHAHPGTDIRAIVDGYASISPLDISLAHPEHAQQLKAQLDRLTAHLTAR